MADRAQRVDAARNREALLAAAEQAFADQGLSASMADIARRAGVAKGTVFRHFPTKADLVLGIISAHLDGLVDAAAELRDSEDPETALLGFLAIAADERQQHDVDHLISASESSPQLQRLRDRLYSALDELVVHARDARVLRADVSTTDVLLLMCAPVHVAGNLPHARPELWRRYLALIFDGLRPAGAHPLPQPAPGPLCACAARVTEGGADRVGRRAMP